MAKQAKQTKEGEDLELITVKFDQLVENADNPNQMNAKDYGRLIDSIKAYGYVEPAVVVPIKMAEDDDDDTDEDTDDVDTDDEDDEDAPDRTQKYYILDGHHRIKAYKEIFGAKTDEICVNLAKNVDESQAYIGAITFNKVRGQLDTMKVATLLQKGVSQFGEKMVAKHSLLGRDALQEYTTILNNKHAKIVDQLHKDGSVKQALGTDINAKKTLHSSTFDNMTKVMIFNLKKAEEELVSKVLASIHKNSNKALFKICEEYLKDNPIKTVDSKDDSKKD